jgi:hypothetical protein
MMSSPCFGVHYNIQSCDKPSKKPSHSPIIWGYTKCHKPQLGDGHPAAFASAIAKPKSLKSDAGVKLSQSHRPLIVGVDLRDWMTDQMETENGVSVIAYDSYSKHDIKVNMI